MLELENEEEYQGGIGMRRWRVRVGCHSWPPRGMGGPVTGEDGYAIRVTPCPRTTPDVTQGTACVNHLSQGGFFHFQYFPFLVVS